MRDITKAVTSVAADSTSLLTAAHIAIAAADKNHPNRNIGDGLVHGQI